MSAGKGSRRRPVDQTGWDRSNYWDYVDKKKKKEKENGRLKEDQPTESEDRSN